MNRRYELIKGELYEVTTGIRHEIIAAQWMRLLLNWNDTARAGNIGGSAGFILERDPDTVRAPDTFFIRKGRLAGADVTKFGDLAPDFVVEVRSPSNTWAELVRKA